MEWRKAIKQHLANSERQVLGWGNEFHLGEPFFVKGGQPAWRRELGRAFVLRGLHLDLSVSLLKGRILIMDPTPNTRRTRTGKLFKRRNTWLRWRLGGPWSLLASVRALQVGEGLLG